MWNRERSKVIKNDLLRIFQKMIQKLGEISRNLFALRINETVERYHSTFKCLIVLFFIIETGFLLCRHVVYQAKILNAISEVIINMLIQL